MLSHLPDEAFLRNEFEAGDGSFLIQLRADLNWDSDSFARLVEAMTICCERLELSGETSLERWIVEGFWHVYTFVPGWASHEAFPRHEGAAYYERAFELLELLTSWAFTGRSSYIVDIRTLRDYSEFSAHYD